MITINLILQIFCSSWTTLHVVYSALLHEQNFILYFALLHEEQNFYFIFAPLHEQNVNFIFCSSSKSKRNNNKKKNILYFLKVFGFCLVYLCCIGFQFSCTLHTRVDRGFWKGQISRTVGSKKFVFGPNKTIAMHTPIL
jgi:hypothetical protein